MKQSKQKETVIMTPAIMLVTVASFAAAFPAKTK